MTCLRNHRHFLFSHCANPRASSVYFMNSHGVRNPVRPTLESIYREHRQGLFSVALSITRRADRAEDAVHDAFARLCRGDKTMTGDPVAYVFAAVRNAAIDITRKRGESSADLLDQTTVLAANTSEGALIASESNECVRAAVESLPVDQREVLVMKLYSGLTFEQIGQAMGEPLSTVASRYRRALDKLKGELASLV